MTKNSILNMKQSQKIMKALANNPELWDKEINHHLKNTKRKENVCRFGEADILYTPPKRKTDNF